MFINKLAIIGVGLIGGSLARALKKGKACNRISGFGRNEENLKKAVALGVIDDYSNNLAEVVNDADVIVIATPLTTFGTLLKEIAVNTKHNAIITDVGSAKTSVVEEAKAILADKLHSFVPGHPIAGTEKSGVEASFQELFQDHLVILTPLEENSTESISLVTRMWESCGARVIRLSVQHHDIVLAATSHLPHVLAYTLVDCLANMDEHDDVFRFSAGGFRDFSRIASSNPEMWSDICISNNENLLATIEHFKSHLDEITMLIKNKDKKGLQEIFTRVKDTRDNLLLNAKSISD